MQTLAKQNDIQIWLSFYDSSSFLYHLQSFVPSALFLARFH